MFTKLKLKFKEYLLSKLCPDCPVLRGEDAIRFIHNMNNSKPLTLVPTPKLDSVLKRICKEIENNVSTKL